MTAAPAGGAESAKAEDPTPPPSLPERLRLMAGLTAPAIRQAVRSFGPGHGSHGLDAGCGIGSHLEWLARGVGPMGRLTALDISDENLSRARDMWELSEPEVAAIDFAKGDIRQIPYEPGVFDWVWCADTLWPGAVVDDPGPTLAEFRRVLRPGGKVALVYWSGQMLLAGHPALESRLNAAFVEVVPYLGGVAPERHFMLASRWLAEAGIRRPRVKTFVAEVAGLEGGESRAALAACYAMLWEDAAKLCTPADRDLFERLCRGESPEFVADTPGYYGVITYTMFWGRVGP